MAPMLPLVETPKMRLSVRADDYLVKQWCNKFNVLRIVGNITN